MIAEIFHFAIRIKRLCNVHANICRIQVLIENPKSSEKFSFLKNTNYDRSDSKYQLREFSLQNSTKSKVSLLVRNGLWTQRIGEIHPGVEKKVCPAP